MNLEVIAVDGIVYTGKVKSLAVGLAEGAAVILPDHEPLMALTKACKAVAMAKELLVFEVGPGLLWVRPDKVQLLVTAVGEVVDAGTQ